MKISFSELCQMQSLPLRLKIKKTILRIEEWYDEYDGMVYCAFSGGIDSTVLADIILQTGLKIPLVFCNTGNEYPEIVDFALSKNPIVIRPKHSFKWVTSQYGYPVISKEVSKNISRYRTTTSEVQKELRLNGGINPTSGKKQHRGIPLKYHYLIDAPFKISDMCCEIIKKQPFKLYNKESGRFPITAEMAAESNKRTVSYMQHGCNNYDAKTPKSTPMGFWLSQNVLEYIVTTGIDYASVYGKIEQCPASKEYYTTGERRTGCYNCMFGVHLESHPNRFERMRENHPHLFNVCMKQGCGKVMDFIGVKY